MKSSRIMSNLLIVALTALAATTVSSFTTVSPTIRTSSTIQPFIMPPTIRNVGLVRASTAAGDNADNNVTNRIIKQLEKEEAKMAKKRELAMAKLSKVE